MKKLVLMVLCGVSLTACGFSPMYGSAFQSEEQFDIAAEFEQISISNIPDREGQFLRNALIDRFYRDGRPTNPRYTLSVSKINESIVGLDITKTSNVTRSQMHVSANISLLDHETGEVVLKRKVRAISSFNELTNEFATRVSEQNTRENALNDLARQIELQLGLYFKR